jgi:hypothetical protein
VDLPAKSQADTYQIKFLARDSDKTQVLIVTNQQETRVGHPWSDRVLKERGVLYVSQNDLVPLSADKRPVGPITFVEESLDPFVGDYSLTNEDNKVDSCEAWFLRSIDPSWYLFYHQNRACPFKGL